MKLSEQDLQKLQQFYGSLYSMHGDNNLSSLSRSSPFTQHIRFEILQQSSDFSGASVLDVGCGFGDFYSYLKQSGINCNYTGIDLMSEFIRAAKEQHPDASFICADVSTVIDSLGSYDIIVASGLFSICIEDTQQKYLDLIKQLFLHSKKTLAFNVLNASFHPTDENFQGRDIAELYSYCSRLTNKLILRQDYLAYDVSLYLHYE